MKFFVLLDENEKLCDLFHMVRLGVYEKNETWQCVMNCDVQKPIEFSRPNMEQFTNQIVTIMNENNSTMIIGSAIIGIPYQIFNKYNINMCEAEDISQELFDVICEDFYDINGMLKSDVKEEVEEVPPYPICIREGFYYFHFDKAMKAHKELSSKKMLIPFLQQEAFTCLTIQCSHIMPWLDYYASQHHLTMDSKREDGEYIVNVRSEYCG